MSKERPSSVGAGETLDVGALDSLALAANGAARAPTAGVGIDAPPGDGPRAASIPHRRFDASALATAEQLLLTVLYAACALLAVGVVLLPQPGGVDWASSTWRGWAVFFPAAMLLLPARSFRGLRQPGVSTQLQLIGLAMRSTAAVLTLETLLPIAGFERLGASKLALLLLVHGLACVVVRHLLSTITRDWSRTLRLVIVGASEQGVALARRLATSRADVEIVGFVDDRLERIDRDGLPARFLGRPSELPGHAMDIDGVVIALPNNAKARVDEMARLMRFGLLNVYLGPDVAVLQREVVGHAHPTGLDTLVLLGMDRLPLQARIAKRLFDIALAAVALAAMLPVLLVIAALIRLESPGPVIFKQRRFGLGNRLFSVYKFRSMRHDPQAERGAIRLTERGDRRVTRMGDFLRRTSLDEYPQFVNVLLGQMSVVGPRPHPPGVKAGAHIYEDVVADFMERYKVRPGITGWAQVNGLRGNTFTETHLTDRFAYDIQYIRNWSIELDVLIVAKTVWGGFRGGNAF